MSRAKPLYDSVPEVYVTFYCDAESHGGQWIIETFVPEAGPDGDELGAVWLASSHQYLKGQFMRRTSGRHATTTNLVSGEAGAVIPVDTSTTEGKAAKGEADERGEFRRSANLKCHRCTDAVRRTSTNMQADLTDLARAGYRDVSLACFRRFSALDSTQRKRSRIDR